MVDNGMTAAGTVMIGAAKPTQKKKQNIAQLAAKDKQLVRGRFNYHEVPGGVLSFVYRAYKGEPVIRYDLKDGEIYNLPLGVARHLNNDVGQIEHSYLLDKYGKPSTMAHRKVRRCSFENLEFVDIEDIGNTHIEEVTVSEIPPLIKE
jgi:hypothetical protein